MQNTEASVAFAGTFVRTVPAAAPFSVIVTQVSLPKQPALSWPVQKTPPGSVALAVPVVSGERLTEIMPRCEPSQHWPPPGVQGQLSGAHAGLPGGGHGVATVPTPPVGQSRV